MDSYWKAAGVALLAVIFILTIGKNEKDISIVLSMIVCCLLGVMAVSYLEPVIDLLWDIHSVGKIQNTFLNTLLKAAGIAFISEMICCICADAGNGSLGKIFQFLGSTVILNLSIPVIRGLLSLVRDILNVL